MLLGKKEEVIQSLDFIKKTYLKLVVLKQLEKEAYENSEYRSLYELSEDERILVEDINRHMKYIVPELVALKNEIGISERISEIDRLQNLVIKKSLMLKKNLEESCKQTRKKLESVAKIPATTASSASQIVNIRA
jgi:antitoxin component HigA of HigAB toxin-antitoxin module